jgi:hypothetical protein
MTAVGELELPAFDSLMSTAPGLTLGDEPQAASIDGSYGLDVLPVRWATG